jgi:hypothetical protein
VLAGEEAATHGEVLGDVADLEQRHQTVRGRAGRAA